MKHYLTHDNILDIELSDDDLFAALTNNEGHVEITPTVWQQFHDLLYHPRVLFFGKDADRHQIKRDGLVSGSSSSYLINLGAEVERHELYFVIWGIYSYSREGLIVGYCMAQPDALLSLQRKKLIDEYLIELE